MQHKCLHHLWKTQHMSTLDVWIKNVLQTLHIHLCTYTHTVDIYALCVFVFCGGFYGLYWGGGYERMYIGLNSCIEYCPWWYFPIVCYLFPRKLQFRSFAIELTNLCRTSFYLRYKILEMLSRSLSESRFNGTNLHQIQQWVFLKQCISTDNCYL